MKLLFVLGTRPEAIKLAPVVNLAKKNFKFEVKVCCTGQHTDMMLQTCQAVDLEIDINLQILNQGSLSLAGLTAAISEKLDKVVSDFSPDWVFVQGDTTTAFVAGLVAFYHKIKVAHVEAGLRSFNKFHPFPEEVNRKLISSFADLHFAPTEIAKKQLLSEGVPETSINLSGNTVIDALLQCRDKIYGHEVVISKIRKKLDFLSETKRLIVVTSHRRENHGENLQSICNALKQLAVSEPNIQMVYPVHLNPNVQSVVHANLSEVDNIHLTKPLGYLEMVYLLSLATLVLTDSGGIQEEVTAFAKPTLILRETTERIESIEAGVAKLIGTDETVIIEETQKLLNDQSYYQKMSKTCYPYGQGNSSELILKTIKQTSKKRDVHKKIVSS